MRANRNEYTLLDMDDQLTTAVIPPSAISARGKRTLAWVKFKREISNWWYASASAIAMTVLMISTAIVAFYWLSA